MTTPYGVAGCLCRFDRLGDGEEEQRYHDNPHCPYHGILPRDRTDTGVYRVVPAITEQEAENFTQWIDDGASGAVNQPRRDTHTCDHPDCTGVDTDHHTVANTMISGYVMECVGRGCPAAQRRPNGTACYACDACGGYEDCDCEDCDQYGECLDCQQAREDREERVRVAAERVARVSEGLNQRLATPPKRAWWRRIMEHFNGI